MKFLALVVFLVALTASSAGATSASYATGFRLAYLPVVATLNKVSVACQGVMTRPQIPACAKRVAAFRAAVAHLLVFVTQTTPPANARAANRELIASLRVMQRSFSKLANYMRLGNLAAVKGMGGLGGAIDNSIQSFINAVSLLDIVLPGKPLPLPG